MDNNVLFKLLIELPSAGAVIVTVILFIRFIKEDRTQAQQERLQMQTFFREIHAEHLDARALTREALEKHATITRENILATQRNTDTLNQLSRNIERCNFPNSNKSQS